LIFLDTSVVINCFTAGRPLGNRLIDFLRSGEEMAISSLVLYEWLRGPRTARELEQQERILPAEAAIPFGPSEAARAALLYRQVRRARTREFDLAIAATAILRQASLWTINPEDFKDIPDLKLV
jgi:predicted nucleic acid-binding protein